VDERAASPTRRRAVLAGDTRRKTRMKTIAKLGLALALVVGLVAAATAADEVTLTGQVLCAKCTLKKADAKQCQNVLVVKNGDQTDEYYVEMNDVATKFGHVCTGRKDAVVTGTVTEKDGKKWIAPTSMEEKKS
jgi:type 1 fimbria pilin